MAQTGALEQPLEKVEKVVEKAHPWIEWFARAGYVAKGVVYILVGILAVTAAFGITKSEDTNQKGVFKLLLQQPFGKGLLLAVAIGLAGYAFWRIVTVVFNPENKKPFKRIGYFVSGAAYGFLAYTAFSGVLGSTPSTDDKSWTAQVMSEPAGQLILAAIGVVIIAVSIGQFINAWKAAFCDVLKDKEMSEGELKFATVIGRFGLFARGVVFALVGAFLIHAAMTLNSKNAGGLDEALRTTADTPFGLAGLFATALGLVSYGVFMFVEARYRRICSTNEFQDC